MFICVLIVFDKLPGHGVLRGCLQFPAVHIPPERNILLQGIRKNHVILKHRPEKSVQFIFFIGAHIFSVNENMSLIRVVKTHQQIDDGSLSASGGPDNAQGSSFFHRKVNPFQTFLSLQPVESRPVRIFPFLADGFSVTERHMIEHYVFLPLRDSRLLCRNRKQLVLLFYHGRNPVRGGIGLGHHHKNPVQSHDSHKDHIEICQKCQNNPRPGDAAVHTPGAHQHHNGQAHIEHKGHDRSRKGHDNACPDIPSRQPGIGILKSAHLVIFFGKRLDHTDSRNVFPHNTDNVVHALLHLVI